MEVKNSIERTGTLVLRQKSIAVWTGLLFVFLFIHMLLDPLLHWST